MLNLDNYVKNKLLSYYLDKIIMSEENLILVENYYEMLKIFLYNQHRTHDKNYYHWIYYLETIYIQIDLINNLEINKKKYRLKNMNKLIELISKKAADITINLSDLIDILTKEIKLSKSLLEEHHRILILDLI